MSVARRKKIHLDFVSGFIYLFIVFVIPLTYYYGVMKPQKIEKQAFDERRQKVIYGDFDTNINRLVFEMNKPEGSQDLSFDLDGNGVVNGADYEILIKNKR